MAEEATVAKATRKKFCSKVYVNKDGTESRHASPDVSHLELRFTSGNLVVIDLTKIGKGCAKAAAWHGVAQKVGDSYNKATTADEAQESAETMLERLVGDEWVKPGEGAGPKTGVLILAITMACVKAGTWDTDSNGAAVEDLERMEANRVRVSTKEGREGAMANAGILAQYKQLQAEAATRRAQEAITKAAASDQGMDGF